jgi:hypothetical protein
MTYEEEYNIIKRIIEERLIATAKKLYPVPARYQISVDRGVEKKLFFISGYYAYFLPTKVTENRQLLVYLLDAVIGKCNIWYLEDVPNSMAYNFVLVTWDTRLKARKL